MKISQGREILKSHEGGCELVGILPDDWNQTPAFFSVKTAIERRGTFS